MNSQDITDTILAMVSGGGSRAESFFIAQGLGAAYNSVSRASGIQKHVNAALHQAEREDRQLDVLRAARAEYDLDDSAETESEPAVAPANSRLFISHASADVKLAKAVANLLRLGTDLPRTRIVCTSLEGMGIPTGTTDYLEFLRSQISDAGLVLPLLTPAFFDSEVCLIEIGAMWGLKQPAYPLIVPPVDFARVEKLLGKVQAARIDKEQGLSDLHDRIVATFGLTANTAMWNTERTDFEAKLPGLLGSLAKGTRVAAADLKRAKKQTSKQRTRLRELERELSETQERLERIIAAKTEEMLEEATQPSGTVLEEFEATAKNAREILRSLSPGVRNAIYEELGQEELYRPEQHSSYQDDAEAAFRDDLLKYDDDNGGYYLNTEDPTMEEAVEAVTELFTTEWDEEVHAWFRKTHRKRLAMDVRAAWVALHLLT